MRILLTGASGNIGTGALQALIEQGHHIRALVTNRARANIAPAYRHHPHVEIVEGDVRDAGHMQRIVDKQDAIIHLAYVIPPESNAHPDLARTVNLDGTHNLIEAACRQPKPPRFLFASTFDLFGNTSDLPPPRRADDPVQVTDLYTAHKLQGEQWVQESGLIWSIFRFSDVPLLGFRSPHPIMFDIPLNQRFEVLHRSDAGLAIANVLRCDAAWKRILLIGGGPRCQITYGEFLFSLLGAMGIGSLPSAAFTTRPYCTDWLDTRESESLLHYQRHSFEDIVREIRGIAGWRRYAIPLVRPLVRQWLLRMSPYINPPAV